MPKRKHHEISTSGSALSTRLSTEQQRLQESFRGHVENAQNQLIGALKLARGFERQKLGRRQKDARSEKEQDSIRKDEERIDAEIKALKALDLSKAADFYIPRTLCRIKTIASSIIMPPELLKKGSAPSPYRDAAVTNVVARLFKSMAVRKVMEAIEAEARKLVAQVKEHSELDQVSNVEAGITGEDEHSDVLDGDSEQSENESASYNQEHSRYQTRNLQLNKNSDEDEDIQMDEDDNFEARIASHSEPDSHSDTGDESISAGDGETFTSLEQSKFQNLKNSLSQPVESKQLVSHHPSIASKPLKSTTFLPTLASGYISGSDSNSYQSDNETATDKPKRRNRMGQQARRALAEQQYGPAAKHLKNSRGNKKGKHQGTRDTGWDLKKGAVDGNGRKSYGFRNDLKPNIKSDSSREHKPKARAKDDAGQLHPSWVAKKKMKEQQSQGISVFQGKKMTFD